MCHGDQNNISILAGTRLSDLLQFISRNANWMFGIFKKKKKFLNPWPAFWRAPGK